MKEDYYDYHWTEGIEVPLISPHLIPNNCYQKWDSAEQKYRLIPKGKKKALDLFEDDIYFE